MSAVLEAWLIARIAQEAGLAIDAVDADTPIYRYGIDSRTLAFVVEGAEGAFDLAADLDRISPAEPISVLAHAFAPIAVRTPH
jgi:hypothetical protein